MYNAEIGLEYQTSTVNEISKDFGGSDFDFAIQQEDRNKLWTARYDFHFCKYTHSPMHPGTIFYLLNISGQNIKKYKDASTLIFDRDFTS